jgi:hypothetical protein
MRHDGQAEVVGEYLFQFIFLQGTETFAATIFCRTPYHLIEFHG